MKTTLLKLFSTEVKKEIVWTFNFGNYTLIQRKVYLKLFGLFWIYHTFNFCEDWHYGKRVCIFKEKVSSSFIEV